MPDQIRNFHHHTSTKTATTGNRDDCILCSLPIIYDGSTWRVIYELGPTKTRKLAIIHKVDQLIAKAEANR